MSLRYFIVFNEDTLEALAISSKAMTQCLGDNTDELDSSASGPPPKKSMNELWMERLVTLRYGRASRPQNMHTVRPTIVLSSPLLASRRDNLPSMSLPASVLSWGKPGDRSCWG